MELGSLIFHLNEMMLQQAIHLNQFYDLDITVKNGQVLITCTKEKKEPKKDKNSIMLKI